MSDIEFIKQELIKMHIKVNTIENEVRELKTVKVLFIIAFLIGCAGSGFGGYGIREMMLR